VVDVPVTHLAEELLVRLRVVDHRQRARRLVLDCRGGVVEQLDEAANGVLVAAQRRRGETADAARRKDGLVLLRRVRVHPLAGEPQGGEADDDDLGEPDTVEQLGVIGAPGDELLVVSDDAGRRRGRDRPGEKRDGKQDDDDGGRP